MAYNAPSKACALDSNFGSMSNRDGGGYGKRRKKTNERVWALTIVGRSYFSLLLIFNFNKFINYVDVVVIRLYPAANRFT